MQVDFRLQALSHEQMLLSKLNIFLEDKSLFPVYLFVRTSLNFLNVTIIRFVESEVLFSLAGIHRIVAISTVSNESSILAIVGRSWQSLLSFRAMCAEARLLKSTVTTKGSKTRAP